MFSIPLMVLTFLMNHIELFLGYAICVLFPIPYLNSWIIGLWTKLLTKDKAIATVVETTVLTVEKTVTPTTPTTPAS